MSFLSRSPSSPPFPIYLLPSVSFRRRSRHEKTTTSTIEPETSIGSSETTQNVLAESYLGGHDSQLRCARCATDFCSSSQIISKGFTGRHGRAYLVSATPSANGSSSFTPKASKASSLPNTHTHKAVPRQLVTGAHTVSDVSCAFCESVIGWKYDEAEEESQRYKIGKYILETKKIYSSSCWETEGWEELGQKYTLGSSSPMKLQNSECKKKENSPEFDSQDEDECEDLFAGVWSQDLAIRRRQGRRFERVITGMTSARY